MSWVDAAVISLLALIDLCIILYLRRRKIRRAMVERILGRSLKDAIERDTML